MISNLPHLGQPSVPAHHDAAAGATAVLRRSEIDSGTHYVAPSGAAQVRLAAIMRDILGLDDVGATDSFFELGGDSLQAIDLFVRIERAFGMVFSPSTLIEFPTVAKLSTLFADKPHSDAEHILVTLQPEGADPALFIIHEASGNLFSYRMLVRELGNARKIYGLIYPGQDRDPIPTLSVRAMAAKYVDAIVSAQANGPYFLLGYSFGGAVAYEAARQLREQGRHVGLLVVVDGGTHDGMVHGLQRVLRKLSRHLAAMSELPPSRWIAYLAQQLQREIQFGHLSPLARLREQGKDQVLPQRLQVLLSGTLMRSHATYNPPPYDGDMKLLRCTEGIGARYALRDRGWGDRVRGGIEIIDLPTEHYMALQDPVVVLAARHLKRWLDEAGESAFK